MHSDPVARVYAQALIELAQERGRMDEIGREFAAVVSGIGAASDLQAFIASPMMDTTVKKRVIEALRGRVDDLLVDFLCLLVDKDRIEAAPDIAAAYRDLADDAAGRTRVAATTAVPLAADLQQRLEQMLHAALARDCVVEAAVEPDLLGGLVLQVGDKIYDGSVRSHLRRIRTAMMRSSGYHEDQG
jgi:F-type H+-transporting ATPase subunit delta